jgi:hypothetical protein
VPTGMRTHPPCAPVEGANAGIIRLYGRLRHYILFDFRRRKDIGDHVRQGNICGVHVDKMVVLAFMSRYANNITTQHSQIIDGQGKIGFFE